MDMKTQIGKSERFGRWLGRRWRGYLRREHRVSAWLVAQRVPARVASVLLWIVKLAVVGVLLYVAFWLTLLLLFAVVAARAASNAKWETSQSEWKNGPAGFGLYTHDGYRIDPHVSDEE